MTIAKIHGAEFPIRKIFSNDFNFKIPLYQRPYSWTTEQAGELLDDLISFIGADTTANVDELSPYFLGSIVLIKDESQPDAEIVDGQQRLTTLTILLSALRHTITTPAYAKGMTDYLYQEGKPLEGTPNRYRLTLRDRDADFFRTHIQDQEQIDKLKKLNEGQLTDSRKNIWANALLFLKRLDGLPESQRVLLAQFIVKNCLLVVVSTPDLDSAYRIFSILNDRGLDLSHSDILKSEVIGRIPSKDQEPYNQKWEDAEEELGRDAFSDLFGHTRTIYCKKKAKESILKEFREYVIKPVGDSRKLIDDVLIPFADAFTTIQTASYESVAGAEQVNELLKWLGRIDNTDWIPPAILFMARNKSDTNTLNRFFADLERLASFLMICQYGINERIERYGKLLDAIEHDADLYAADAALQLSQDEQLLFINALNGDVYQQVPKRRLYILLRLDSALSDGCASYDHTVISIEHVLPQNPPPSSEWCEWFPTQELRDRWVHRLGNLLLLSRKKNSSASNYDFEKKKTAYFTKGGISPFPLTTQAIAKNKWTLEVVEDFQKNALRKLRDVWRIEADTSAGAVANGIVVEDKEDDDIAQTPGKDLTKVSVEIDGVIHNSLPNREAVLKVVKHLCNQGVAPDDIASTITWRTTFCSLDGSVTSEEFVAKQKGKIPTQKYFCDDSDLIHCSNRTYALSAVWGKRTFEAIQKIIAKFPGKGVACEALMEDDPSKLKFTWHESIEIPSNVVGHGIEFHDAIKDEDGEYRMSEKSLVGFVEGFGWLHGTSNDVVAYCITPNAHIPKAVLSEMKKQVEELLSMREVPPEQITDRIRSWANA